MKERRAATAVMPARYRRAGKKAKRRLRDELPGLTGDIRWYAAGSPRGTGAREGLNVKILFLRLDTDPDTVMVRRRPKPKSSLKI